MRTAAWILCILLLLIPAGMAEDGQPEEYSTDDTSTEDPAGETETSSGSETETQTESETETETETETESESGTETPEARTEDPEEDEDEFEDDDEGFHASTSEDETLDFAAPEARAVLSRPGVDRLETQVDSLIEFRDEDGNGAYDLGEPVLQRLALRDLPVTIDNSTAGVRDVVYDLGAGTLTLRFHAATTGPAKFDVLLDGFPYSDANGLVAVASRVDVAGGVRMTEVDGHPAVAGQRGEEVAYLSWVPTVDTEYGPAPVAWSVHVSVSSDHESAIVYWAYPHATHIIHDPVLGVTFIPLEHLGDPMVFGVAAAGTVLLLLMGFEVRRRFRP